MSAGLIAEAWPLARLGEAIGLLARRGGLAPRPVELPPPAAALGDDEGGLERWVDAAAGRLGVSAETVETTWGDLEPLIRGGGPALLRCSGADGHRFLAVLRAGRASVEVLGTDLEPRRVAIDEVRDALGRDVEVAAGAEIDRLLEEAAVPPRRLRRARRALVAERLARRRALGFWILRRDAGDDFWSQLKSARVPRTTATMIAAHAVQYVLLILSWWVLGRGVLAGSIDPGWLLAWAGLLLTITPFRILEYWSLGLLTTRVGALLKRRLFAGILRLEPEEIRSQGAGQFLGRVIDSEAVESLVLSGGHVGLIAGVEILLALPVLWLGAGGLLQTLLLPVWVLLALGLWWKYLAGRRRWTAARLGMTHELVEKMVGHRTRLAQEPLADRHAGEDEALGRYLELSRAMDRRATLLRILVPRGWLVVGFAALGPAFVTGRATLGALAVGIGGVLLAYRALWKLVRGLSDLAEAAIAWDNVAPLFQAAGRREDAPPPDLALASGADGGAATGPVLEAREIVFGYGGRPQPVLDGLNLRIDRADRLLLEGPSGCGKSTLAALLAGLRIPDSGLLFVRGLDRHTLGSTGWRRRVAAAPQFHENHVLTDTFAFNALMGREWPAGPADLAEAEEVCRELGLGEVLDRMPAGLLQLVGESGWQLSHGERSRLYIARALLQRSDLVILDESFAALDPENLRRALETVLERAPALLVIAHP